MSCLVLHLTEKLVKFSEIQIKLKNKSNFLKLEENSRDNILKQEVILLGEHQETEPVQEKNKLLHVSLWLHSTAGASGNRDLREAQTSPWLGVMAASWAGVTNDTFFCKVRMGMSHQWIPRLHFSGLQSLIPCLERGSQTITRPNCTFNHHLSVQDSYVRETSLEVSFLLLMIISSAKTH